MSVSIRTLIDDWSLPLASIIALREFTPQDFEYILMTFPFIDKQQLYKEYSKYHDNNVINDVVENLDRKTLKKPKYY